jgi:hypothetical protein
MRKSFYLLLIGCLLSIHCFSQPAAQNIKTNRSEQLQATLRPEKGTIMFGETTFLIFEVKNLSKSELYTPIGLNSDTNGRPTNFNVTVTASDGKAVPQPAAGGMHGFSGFAKIPAKGSYIVKLYLPHWATFVETGRYSVSLKINLNIRGSSDDSLERFQVELGTKIKIVRNKNKKLGKVIDKLGRLMLESRNPESVDAAQLLAFFEDPRVIKYHASRLQKFVPSDADLSLEAWFAQMSIWALRKYNHDSALEALKKVMSVEDVIVRSQVAQSLLESPHPKALDVLLNMRNDESSVTRFKVVLGLEKMKSDESTRLLREMLNDNDQWVREKAQKILDKREQK